LYVWKPVFGVGLYGFLLGGVYIVTTVFVFFHLNSLVNKSRIRSMCFKTLIYERMQLS
jgi:hypothetical protein